MTQTDSKNSRGDQFQGDREEFQMSPFRKTALVAGVLYLLTFVSIPTLFLYGPVHDPKYILGPGPDTAVLVGGILEIIVALAGIGTAVALYPVVKRQNEGVALGFVGSRVLEASTIFAGVASLLSVVTLRQAGAGAGALVASQTLVALYDRTFFLGQSFIPAVNALLLGSLLYQSRLVPRVLPVLGFTGAALLVASDTGILFGLWGPMSSLAAIAALPIAIWEFSLGVYLVVKGFKPSPILSSS
ncbi:MAG TPA: DUF4386 domain-containing protein [Ktedonobacteraceae bacterium]